MSCREENGRVIREQERKAFEIAISRLSFDHFCLERMTRNQDFYRSAKTQHAWEGWQLRAQLTSREP